MLQKYGTKQSQIYSLLRSAIIGGYYPNGSKLPGELKLAELHNVSRVTIRAAIQALKEGGLVKPKAGVGTVVTYVGIRRSMMQANVSDLMPNLIKMANESKVKLLEFQYLIPSSTVIKKLKLKENEKTQRSVRVRLMDGCPFSYLITHVNECFSHQYDEADLASTPLYLLLEQGGVKIAKASETISATLAEHEIAQALDVPIGSPLIALTRVIYDTEGVAVEYLEAFYRPDQFQLEIELDRVGDTKSRYWLSK
jgi:GntR family transcriptional regulator